MKYKVTLLLSNGRELNKLHLFNSRQNAIRYASNVVSKVPSVLSYSIEEVE